MSALLIAVLVVTCGACTRSEASFPVAPTTSGGGPSASAAACLVTLPDGSHRRGDPAGLEHLGYGNGELWVGLWPHGRVRATVDDVNPHGFIAMKFPWDRGVRGKLRITGHRLDADAPRLRVHLSDFGAAGFQPSTLVFPTEGCWQVTGSVGGSSLTFVTLVTMAG